MDAKELASLLSQAVSRITNQQTTITRLIAVENAYETPTSLIRIANPRRDFGSVGTSDDLLYELTSAQNRLANEAQQPDDEDDSARDHPLMTAMEREQAKNEVLRKLLDDLPGVTRTASEQAAMMAKRDEFMEKTRDKVGELKKKLEAEGYKVEVVDDAPKSWVDVCPCAKCAERRARRQGGQAG